MGSHSLLQGIFPTQGSNPGLLNCRQILYQLSSQGSPGWRKNQLISPQVEDEFYPKCDLFESYIINNIHFIYKMQPWFLCSAELSKFSNSGSEICPCRIIHCKVLPSFQRRAHILESYPLLGEFLPSSPEYRFPFTLINSLNSRFQILNQKLQNILYFFSWLIHSPSHCLLMAVQFIVEALGWHMCSRMWERNVMKSQGSATLERFQVHPQSRVYRTIPSKTNDRSLCLIPLVCVFLCVLVSQSCPTFCDPMGCSLPGSSVLGILQARILEWVASHSLLQGIFPT